ncbi:hypothetical protein NAT47_00525 [Flavobacterium sp. HXWNR69]|uniref:Uncharacterized protein n=1 Tax=Flavobacterium fragile TaxID=2949085 RepID=A0ABT0TD56_9FLAO|nr:hypothetical protein [Flavobacterium sp. HXWNR69]MCL9768896.1 hypothetical protein [Flavobacterium sp. HXWNR69]
MARNPKIEFFKIKLNATKSDENITFRDLFTGIYNTKNPKNNKDNLSDKILMKTFLQHIFTNISGKFKVDNSKKKAFYVKGSAKDQNDSVKLGTDNYIVHGLVKGGPYDTGKEEGDLNNPLGENKKLKKATILLDDFYFLLYTPLDKGIGILILQNYTSDQIADIFKPFVKGLFRVEKKSYNAYLEEFMPIEMQKDFKENSAIKKFVFSNQYLISDLDEDVKSTGKFNIQLTVSSSDTNINVNNLSLWRKVMRKIKFDVPGNEPRFIESFNKQSAYIKDETAKSNPTKFSLDDDLLKIKATIYLENYIGLEENRIPKWKELEKFAQETLKEIVIPEVYPEDFIDEN